jgi:hypothetical protein
MTFDANKLNWTPLFEWVLFPQKITLGRLAFENIEIRV